jgi:hypothetical protein
MTSVNLHAARHDSYLANTWFLFSKYSFHPIEFVGISFIKKISVHAVVSL